MTPKPAEKEQTVRAEVLSLLQRSEAFRALPEYERTRLADDMSKVGSYLADKDWLANPPARALDLIGESGSAVDSLKERLARDPGFAGEDFKAGAIKQGVQAFKEMVKTVDFPKFVSGLIEGVFKAIVDSSIQQMQAYAELLSAVAKTVDEFSESISDSIARDHIANRFPSAVRVDTEGGSARLRASDSDSSVDLAKEFGLSSSVDLDDEESEQRLVMAAKQDLARSKQQLLATMVLMGINRIVITNGHINAKVVFDMRASDAARRRHKAELHDKESQHQGFDSGWASSILGGSVNVSHDHETTVGSSLDETSDSKAQVKAQLTGDVRLAFKSETFPLEKMVDVFGMQMLGQKATPAPMRRPPAQPAAPAAAPAIPPGGAPNR